MNYVSGFPAVPMPGSIGINISARLTSAWEKEIADEIFKSKRRAERETWRKRKSRRK